MNIIGMTGGLAAGKSAAAKLFAAKGAAIIDADAVARELSAPGGGAAAEIKAAFGEVNRAELRGLVFADPAARKKLEAILHPKIRAETERRLGALAADPPPYALIVAPLLLEAAGFAALVDRVLVIDCPPQTQRARAAFRDGWTEAHIRAALGAQLCRAARRRRADDIINNSGDWDALGRQVDFFDARYRRKIKRRAPRSPD